MAGVHCAPLTDDELRNLTQVSSFVFDLIPKAMRRLATSVRNSWTPEAIQRHYIRCAVKIDNRIKLSINEKEMFRNPGDGFINCDSSCLYKIIRYFDLVPRPTLGWTAEATYFENYGDFVEKLREIRNSVVHSPHVRFSENEMYIIQVNICIIIEAMCRLAPNEELKLHLHRYLPEPYSAHLFEN